jgi:hypothetical protein
MRKTITVPFRSFAPDSFASSEIGGATVGYPRSFEFSPEGFRPVRKFVTASVSDLGTFAGAYTSQSITGTEANFVGTHTKLYKDGVDVSKTVTAAGVYSVAVGEFWDFAQFGNNVIAVNGANTAQTISLAAGAFGDLGGGPPKAKHIAVVRDFVVMGNLDEGGTVNNSRVRWSAINNSASWTVNGATQADYQDLPGPGQVRKLVGGDIGWAFRDSDIWRFNYVGSPVIFEFQQIHQKVGCPHHNGVCVYQDVAYFYSGDGFYAMSLRTGELRPIGEGRVNKWMKQFSFATIPLSAAIDPKTNSACWLFSVGGSDRALLRYDVTKNDWAYEASGDLGTSFTPYAIANWDDDLLVFASDSDGYKRDTSSNFQNATLVTAPMYAPPGKVATVFQARPLASKTSISTLKVHSKIKESDSYTATTGTENTTNGAVDVIATGREFIFELTIDPGTYADPVKELEVTVSIKGAH